MERDDNAKKNSPVCPPSGDAWAYQSIHEGNSRRHSTFDNKKLLIDGFTKYSEFQNSLPCLALSGIGLTAWLYYNTLKLRNDPAPNFQGTKFGIWNSVVDVIKTANKPTTDICGYVANGQYSSAKYWVDANLAKSFSVFEIFKAVANPSPFPMPEGGWRMPLISPIGRSIFLATAPKAMLSDVAQYFLPVEKAHFMADLVCHARQRLFWNGVRGITLGVLASSLLPIHPIVGLANTGNTIVSSVTLLRNVSDSVEREIAKVGGKQAVDAVNKLITHSNRAVFRSYAALALPPVLVTAVVASGFSIAKHLE